MSATKKAINIAKLDKSVETKLIQYKSLSSALLKEKIGETIYSQYILLPDDALVAGEVGFVEYEALTSDQRKRRDLETAQAYFMLYYLVAGIKQLEMNTVFLDKIVIGDGTILPADASSARILQKTYYELAIAICNNYSATGDISIMVI